MVPKHTYFRFKILPMVCSYKLPVSKFIFIKLCILAVITFLNVPMASGQSYLIEIQKKWSNSAAYLQEMAEALPDSRYNFKPTTEEMTFSEQLVHIAQNMIHLSQNQLGYKTIEPPIVPDQKSTPSDVRQFLKSAFVFAGKAIAQETKESLNTETSFFAGPKSHRQIINLMNDHVTHHRGQLIVYLRLNGVTPGKYVGW